VPLKLKKSKSEADERAPLRILPGVNTSALLVAGVATVARGGTTWDGGIILNSNGSNQYLTAEWTSASNGSLELWKYNGGWTQLGGVTNLYTSPSAAPASIELRAAVLTTGVLEARINGVVTASVTLSAADQTLFVNAAHQRIGVLTYQSTSPRFNDFHVDTV